MTSYNIRNTPQMIWLSVGTTSFENLVVQCEIWLTQTTTYFFPCISIHCKVMHVAVALDALQLATAGHKNYWQSAAKQNYCEQPEPAVFTGVLA